MKASNINQTQNFGANILLVGSKRNVYTAFAKITCSERMYQLRYTPESDWSTMTAKSLLKYKKFIAIGQQDAKKLKKYTLTIPKRHSGLATKGEFSKFAKDIPEISAKKVLKSIKNGKFDFATLQIKE